MRRDWRLSALASVLLWMAPSICSAELRFVPGKVDGLPKFIAVGGEFSPHDQLEAFNLLLRHHQPSFVVLSSNGGNPYKAMELGRLIRRHQLNTVVIDGQTRCVSACVLAFLGGVNRYATAGTLGVHKMSLGINPKIDARDMLSATQSMVADTMAYVAEMGVEQRLIELALRYEASDIRYLSKSEMAHLKVTNGIEVGRRAPNGVPTPNITPNLSPSPRDVSEWPVAKSGQIRHPRGLAALKSSAEQDAIDISSFTNGTPVEVLASHDDWYRVKVNHSIGYMHQSWLLIDQFRRPEAFDERHIQIKTTASLAEARDYVRKVRVSLSELNPAVFASTQKAYVVASRKTFERHRAVQLLQYLKLQSVLPQDAFVSFGNTYIKDVCCQ